MSTRGVVSISENESSDANPGGPAAALFALGFRPFFLGASILAVTSMALWASVWRFDLALEFTSVSSAHWHGHELIYGYAMAVIAGFLLTAVRNWTGRQTPGGLQLFALFLCWMVARVAFFFGDTYLIVAAIFDGTFALALIFCIGLPIVAARQWSQLAIVSKVVLLGVGNALFYAGAMSVISQGARWGVYMGLYLVIGLILTMGRRVIPAFIERGVGYPVVLTNRRWIDHSSMILFVGFFILDTFTQHKDFAGVIAVVLFVLHCIRAAGWHTGGIWRKPLLWSLYGAYLFIVSGFGLYALSIFTGFSSYVLAIHAFAIGGIGLITIGMMARVALGHTGRDVHAAPNELNWVFALIALTFVIRVLLPMADAQHYLLWLSLSALTWILGFILFLIIFAPILARRRVDNRPG